MNHFHYRKGELFCEDIPVRKLANRFETPLYVYSLKTFIRHFKGLSDAFDDMPHLICYAAKANSNLAILKTASMMGAGADIVSLGEMKLALKAGISRDKIVFSGVGKTDQEIEEAVRTGILFICAESISELESIERIAGKLRTVARVAVRVNPGIDPHTHPYIATGLKESKFGLSESQARKAYRFCHKSRWLDPVGISMHIGSQVESVKPYYDSAVKIIELYKYLWKQNIKLRYIDIGGGWAAHFDPALNLPYPRDYVSAVSGLVRGLPVVLVVEPGRSLIGSAGIMLMKVIRIKKDRARVFCVVDSGMNDFIRVPLYGARHRIEPVNKSSAKKATYDIVGPVCESSDYFAKSAILPVVKEGDLLALFTAGAYGRSMGSNYNARRGAAEIAVLGKKSFVIRQRESYDDLARGQRTTGINRKLLGEMNR